MQVLSGLIVSVDAFFIGISLGLQEKCKFLHIAVINIFLFALCMTGFFVAGYVYEHIPFDADLVVGISFIMLGSWYILNYFLFKKGKPEKEASITTIIIAGLVMSLEAMLITMGITFVFMPYSTIIIPITVAVAHFGYCLLSFFLVRVKYMKKMPITLSHIISGLGLIVYGLLAIFLEL